MLKTDCFNYISQKKSQPTTQNLLFLKLAINLASIFSHSLKFLQQVHRFKIHGRNNFLLFTPTTIGWKTESTTTKCAWWMTTVSNMKFWSSLVNPNEILEFTQIIKTTVIFFGQQPERFLRNFLYYFSGLCYAKLVAYNF